MAESEWLTFHDGGTTPSGKTRLWTVTGSGGDGDVLGVVKWSGAWRQYVFVTRPVHVTMASSCLQQLDRFLVEQTTAHRNNTAEVSRFAYVEPHA